MNQVQILPVDMPVGVDNKGVDTNLGKDASKGSDDFGAILAKHNVDSDKSGKSGKPENVNGNNSPEGKVDSRATSDDKGDTQATSEKDETTTDVKRIVSDKGNKDDEVAVITIPSEKELKSEQAKDALLVGEVGQDKSLKTSDDVLALFGKNIEREAMPAEVDELPDELIRKTENATKSNTGALGGNAEKTEDKANQLLTMLDEIKGISTEHVKVSDKNSASENTDKPLKLDLQSEEQNTAKPEKVAQKVIEGVEPSEESLLDAKPTLTADKTAIAKAVEQNIQSNNVANESLVNEEIAASEEFKESVANTQSNIASENIIAKSAQSAGEEIASVDEEKTKQTSESIDAKAKVNTESLAANINTEVGAKEKSENSTIDLSVAAAQNGNLRAENTKEISEARGDSHKQAQVDNATSVRASSQGSNANQENSDNKQQAKQQSLDPEKAIAAESKVANTVNEQVKTEAETTKVDRTAAPAAPSHVTSSVASAQAFVDKLTLEANPVTNVRQQAAVADVISINRPDFSNAVKEKVMVMVNQKIRQLDIRLDPPELGSMQIKVNMQNEQAVVSFMVQNQSAKEAIEQQLSRFKDMMSESGVDVGEANVSQQQEKDQGELAEHQNEGQRSAQAEDANEDDLTVNPAQLYKASSTGVDYFV